MNIEPNGSQAFAQGLGGLFVTGSSIFLIDGGITASYRYGERVPN